MNITEANNVNVVLRWILGHYGATHDDAREAAEYLAARASKALLAGLTADDVRADWPEPADTEGAMQ